jgi:hypothetical protein
MTASSGHLKPSVFVDPRMLVEVADAFREAGFEIAAGWALHLSGAERDDLLTTSSRDVVVVTSDPVLTDHVRTRRRSPCVVLIRRGSDRASTRGLARIAAEGVAAATRSFGSEALAGSLIEVTAGGFTFVDADGRRRRHPSWFR